MADMIVAGAGYSAANGTYTEISPVNSHSAWQYNTCYIMWGSGTLANRWVIKSDNVPSSTGNLLYYSGNASSYATPADVPSWTVWSNIHPPAPTVTAAGGSSQNLTLTCSAGSYSLTGTNADLTVTRHYTLTCEAGSYSLTGTNADLTVQRNYVLACNAGSFALTGTNANLTVQRNYVLACNAGSFALTGTNADLYRSLVMACNAGSYALTGSDVAFNANYIFALGMGSYVLVGTNAGLFILSPTPACRTYAIDSEGRLYAIWAESRDYAIPFENRTLEAKCH